jgi:hypothetical protein
MRRADCGGYAQSRGLRVRLSGCRRHAMIIVGLLLLAAAVVIAAG